MSLLSCPNGPQPYVFIDIKAQYVKGGVKCYQKQSANIFTPTFLHLLVSMQMTLQVAK